jgi:hypothetical protein
MPPVAYCDYNNSSGTPWEAQMNGVTPVRKAITGMNTFINTAECGSRNNEFQHQVIKNQYNQDANYVSSGFGIDESVPQNMPDLEPVSPVSIPRRSERVEDEIEISKLYEPYQNTKVKRIPNYMGMDQGLPSYDDYSGGENSIRSYLNSYIRPYAQENFMNMTELMTSNDKELIFLYIILIIFCILFVGQLTDLIKVLYKVS